MDELLADSFASATVEVLHEIGIEATIAGAPNGPAPEGDGRDAFAATVGVLGDSRGSLLLRLDRQTAQNIVTAMYRSLGLEDRQPKEVAEGAVAEIANQICGRAVTILSQRDVECDITPPAVVSGKDLTASLPGTVDLACRRIEGAFGALLIFLGLKS